MIKDDNVRIFITISKADDDFLNGISKYTGFTKSELIKFSVYDCYKKDKRFKNIVDMSDKV